jgi:hypothetical protein
MSAQKMAAVEMQLGYAPPTFSAVSGSRANEIGPAAAEPTTQMDDGDGLGRVFVFPAFDPHGIGKVNSLSLRTHVDRSDLVFDDPLAGTVAAGLKAALLRQLINIER